MDFLKIINLTNIINSIASIITIASAIYGLYIVFTSPKNYKNIKYKKSLRVEQLLNFLNYKNISIETRKYLEEELETEYLKQTYGVKLERQFREDALRICNQTNRYVNGNFRNLRKRLTLKDFERAQSYLEYDGKKIKTKISIWQYLSSGISSFLGWIIFMWGVFFLSLPLVFTLFNIFQVTKESVPTSTWVALYLLGVLCVVCSIFLFTRTWGIDAARDIQQYQSVSNKVTLIPRFRKIVGFITFCCGAYVISLAIVSSISNHSIPPNQNEGIDWLLLEKIRDIFLIINEFIYKYNYISGMLAIFLICISVFLYYSFTPTKTLASNFSCTWMKDKLCSFRKK